MTPARADLEIVGVGVIEANAFARFAFSRGVWPDGTQHAAQRRLVRSRWTVERTPRGWVASDDRDSVALVEDEVVHLQGLPLRITARDAPLLDARLRVATTDGEPVDLVDVRWPLTNNAPWRLGVHRGSLVELMRADYARIFRMGVTPVAEVPRDAEPWLCFRASFAVPMRFLATLAEQRPFQRAPADELVDVAGAAIGLDGVVRTMPRPPDEQWGIRDLVPRSLVREDALFPGAIAGLFPELYAEWRALEEQAAMHGAAP